LRTVEACCRPLQHTAEAATAARGKYFALYDHLGFGSVFMTIRPTANRNLHVKAFALAKSVVIPKQWMMSENDIDIFLDEMIDLNKLYPGAGEIEFRSQLDIFIYELLKWDRKTNNRKVLVYLVLLKVLVSPLRIN